MKLNCKHCGTSYPAGKGDGEFCCAGCHHVYDLIRNEGLDTYYSLQDRVGKPVGDLSNAVTNVSELRELQVEAESKSERPQVILRLDGMSCLGCVWLVERLGRAQPDCCVAQASLQSNTLAISWRQGSFDLPSLASVLAGFGYRLSLRADNIRAWSSLTWRSWISSLLAVNALFLGLLLEVLGEDVQAAGFIQLLFIAVGLISLLVGLPQFLSPVVRAFNMRTWHHDGLLVSGLCLLVPTLFLHPLQYHAWKLPLALSILLLARSLHTWVWGRMVQVMEIELTVSEEGVGCAQRALFLNAVLVLLFVAASWIQVVPNYGSVDWAAAASICLVFCTYPLAIGSRYKLPLVWLLAGLGLGWIGVVMACASKLPLLTALSWMIITGVAWMSAFVVWQKRRLGPK